MKYYWLYGLLIIDYMEWLDTEIMKVMKNGHHVLEHFPHLNSYQLLFKSFNQPKCNKYLGRWILNCYWSLSLFCIMWFSPLSAAFGLGLVKITSMIANTDVFVIKYHPNDEFMNFSWYYRFSKMRQSEAKSQSDWTLSPFGAIDLPFLRENEGAKW